MQQSVQQRLVPPPRPPPPNFGASAASPRPGPTVAIPVSPAVPESPASPVGSAYSPTDTPTKRITPSPYSPNRLACDRSYYVARQDHQFALPADCPDNRPARPPMPFSAANPPLQPAPEAHRERVRRRAPSPPRPVGRGRGGPFLAALHGLSHVPGTFLRILYQTFKVRPLLRPWSEPFPGHLKLPGPRHRRLLKFLHQELHHQTFF